MSAIVNRPNEYVNRLDQEEPTGGIEKVYYEVVIIYGMVHLYLVVITANYDVSSFTHARTVGRKLLPNTLVGVIRGSVTVSDRARDRAVTFRLPDGRSTS